MLTYTFSRREKVLIAVFTILLMAVGWYQLVYVTTTNQMHAIETEIEEVELNIKTEQTRLAKEHEMMSVIEQKIAEGAKATPIPNFNNIKPLMKELDELMSRTSSYTLSFDALDTESSEYILRGVRMQFVCADYGEADAMVRSVAEGAYPCMIDSINFFDINKDNSLTGEEFIRVDIHVIFLERPVHAH